ncbi:hypothetical protein [Herbaspirillum sp. NPDC101397]
MKKSLAGHAMRGILHWSTELADPTRRLLMLLKKRAENRIGRFALL